MRPEPEKFKDKAKSALDSSDIQRAMADNREFAAGARKAALSDPDLGAMKARARKIKDHTLDHLPRYLEAYEQRAAANGISVHWAETAPEARQLIRTIATEAGAQIAVCGKSMIAAEIEAPRALADCGVDRYETDLGEYILQLAGDEPPSHVNGPAVHKTLDQIRALFDKIPGQGDAERGTAPEAILAKARRVLRKKFLSADLGVIGANFLIAETGGNVLVSNEGNADLSALLPKTVIVLASIEKVLPRLADAELFLRLLCLSATGQRVTAYQSVYHGPRKDADRPQNVHLILVDNGRSRILHSKYRPILRCVRCGSCMDNCPVYSFVGGHPYGWIYPGPMGVVWSTQLNGFEGTRDLAHACSLNGHCSEVCPMGIPLKDMIRSLRDDQWDRGMTPPAEKALLEAWGQMVLHPGIYGAAVSAAGLAGNALAGKRGSFQSLPFAGGWTGTRNLPAFKKAPFRNILNKEGKKR